MKKVKLTNNPVGNRTLTTEDFKSTYFCPYSTSHSYHCGDHCALFDIRNGCVYCRDCAIGELITN